LGQLGRASSPSKIIPAVSAAANAASTRRGGSETSAGCAEQAFSSPLRKIWYNITTTGLSVAVALLIGSIEILQVLSDRLGWKGTFFEFLNDKLDFGVLGYIIVGMFLVAWIGSVLLWKTHRVEQRYGDRIAEA
jgi:hypothetical protein